MTSTRRAPRYPIALHVELRHAIGLTRNVSAGGVYFVTYEALTPGEALDFTLVLETLKPEAPWRVHCRGTVLRVERQGNAVGAAVTIDSYRISP